MKRLQKSGSLSTEQYKKIKAVGSRPGILYGLCKVHKAITEVCPPFRPLLSAIGTPSYKLPKFLVPKLSSVKFNEFTVKDFLAFAEEIVYQDSKLFMGTLDVDSLFTNIPLEETINICTNLLYNNEDVIESITKSEFKNLLSLASQESYFIFKSEVKWLEQCPKEFKPVFYRRYVDDIFVLFESAEHLSKFCDYFNSRHPNMYFSFEQKKMESCHFLM